MVGITLSPEQIRNAPLVVRRWLEQEIAAALNPQPEPAAPRRGAEHLIACEREEAAAIYAAVRSALPVVNVLFELGREGESVGAGDIGAYRLVDMLGHARLQSLEQLSACLEALNEVARRIRGDADATLYLLDGRGACVVATMTQKNILGVWRQVVAGQDPAAGHGDARTTLDASVFPGASTTIPRSAIHMEGSFPDSAAQSQGEAARGERTGSPFAVVADGAAHAI